MLGTLHLAHGTAAATHDLPAGMQANYTAAHNQLHTAILAFAAPLDIGLGELPYFGNKGFYSSLGCSR